MIILVIINIVGFFFGMYYYWYQLSITPWFLWIFVIDCPLYALLFAVVLTMRLKGKTSNLLNTVTSIGLVKYGLWTGIVVVLFWNYYFSTAAIIYSMIFPLHIGMILEGLLLIPKTRVAIFYLPLVTSWFLINDFMDYIVGTVPLIPPGYMPFLFIESVAATFVMTMLVFTLSIISRKK